MPIFNLKHELPLHRKTLSNGLSVIIVQKKKAPIVSVNLSYRVGSKDEKKGITGFAHLFEHMMFEGTKNVKKGYFDKLCSTAGGTNNAYTTYDWTSYIMTLPKHQLELALWLESDRMINYKVDPEAFKNQQNVVTEEIKQTVENQPYARWREALASNSFTPECSYSWEVHGSIPDIAKSTVEDAIEFHKGFYKPNNAALALVGDIEPDEAFELVEQYFQTAQKNEVDYNRNHFDKSMIKRKTHEIVRDNIQLPAVFLSFHLDGFYSDEMFTAEVVTNVASGGKSSRLYDSLVYEKQIASSIGSFVDKRESSSLLTFYAIANTPKITSVELYEGLMQEISKLYSEKVKDNELEKSENIVITEAAHELQHSAGIADYIANQTLFFNEPERLYTLLDKYKRVNKDMIFDFCSKYLKEDNSVRIDVIPV